MIERLRWAVRGQLRRRQATSWVVGSLALGIALNAAVFSLLYASYLKPLPFDRPGHLFTLSKHFAPLGINAPLSPPLFRELAESKAFAQIGGFISASMGLRRGDHYERVGVFRADAELFDLLKAPFILGRPFRSGEDDAVILSEGLWRSHFGASREVVGQSIELRNSRHIIAGVLSSSVALPTPQKDDLWIPMHLTPEESSNKGFSVVSTIVRLSPDVNVDEALARLESIDPKIQWRLKSLHSEVTGATDAQLFVLQAAALLLLIIVCANVSFLLFSTAIRRKNEMDTRVALGASRGHLLRQLIEEAFVLIVPASLLGLLGALGLQRILVAWVPSSFRRLSEVGWNWPVIAATVSIALLCIVVCSAAPLLKHLRRSSVHSRGPSRRGGRFVALVVTGECATAVILVVLAGLMLTALDNIFSQDLGMDTRRMLVINAALPGERTRNPEASLDYYTRVLERIRRLPVVGGATVSSLANFNPVHGLTMIPSDAEMIPVADISVLPDYFSTIGARIVEGRPLNARDTRDSIRVTVVSQSLARKLGKGIGDEIQHYQRPREIVGIVADMKVDRPNEKSSDAVFVPSAQHWAVGPFLLIRTNSAAPDLPRIVRSFLAEEDPEVIIGLVAYGDDLLAATMEEERFRAALLSIYASMALSLIAIGLFGTLSYAVAVHRRSTAIRKTLGATNSRVILAFLARYLLPVMAGVAGGLPIALLVVRRLIPPLFNINADPLVFLSAGVLLPIIALLAAIGPMSRALRDQPTDVLRQE